jgi:hypothetical protein
LDRRGAGFNLSGVWRNEPRHVGDGAAERISPIAAVFDEPILQCDTRIQLLYPRKELHELQRIERKIARQRDIYGDGGALFPSIDRQSAMTCWATSAVTGGPFSVFRKGIMGVCSSSVIEMI